jgi:putative ABC transport system substrate-binding protein
MRRRDVITVLGGAACAALPFAGLAQQQRRAMRIGVLIGSPPSDPEVVARLAALRHAIKELGWVEGENLHIEYRWPADDPRQARAYAAELVAMRPNVIFAGGTSIAAILQRETSSLPIVFTQVADPVGAGLVESFARPGRNATGFSHFEFPFAAKWVELLKEVAPQVSRVAVIYDPSNPASTGYLPVIDGVARRLAMESRPFAVRSAAEIESTVGAFAREAHGGLILIPGPIMGAQRKLLISVARAHRLPSVYGFRYHPAEGGLMSYGVDLNDLYRRAASYLDRILKGEKPADLPVQAPTKFDLVINLATAKALGILVPVSLLARADEVIE